MKNLFTRDRLQRAQANASFSKLIERRLDHINGLPFRNGGRGLINEFLRTIGLIHRHWNKSKVKIVCVFVFKLTHLILHSGVKGAVIYMKASQVLLQQGVASYYVRDLTELKVRVKRTRRGLPVWIPTEQRALIRGGDIPTIRVWMTLFGIFRVLSFKGKLSLATITQALSVSWLPEDEWLSFIRKDFFAALRDTGVKLETAVSLVPAPFPISRSSPTTALPREGQEATKGFLSTSWPSLVHAARELIRDPLRRHYLQTILKWVEGDDFWARLRWCATEGYRIFQNLPARVLVLTKNMTPLPGVLYSKVRVLPLDRVDLGKLGIKKEPAGKVRVFAMVDPWTQWLFAPIHKAIFSLLERIPMDGTFNQTAPLERLVKKFAPEAGEGAFPKRPNVRVQAYSLDLSAATDRLPVALQIPLLAMFLMSCCFVPSTKWPILKPMADMVSWAWAELLVGRSYIYVQNGTFRTILSQSRVSVKKMSNITLSRTLFKNVIKVQPYMKLYTVKYAVGQPMGALSSWAMLALTHHAIVQWAAYRVCQPKAQNYVWFQDYAILGDDVVIVDREVAEQYLSIIRDIGMKVGLAKSIISKGELTLEFAKKFLVSGRWANMIPFRESITSLLSWRLASVLASRNSLALAAVLRFYGYGYKVRAMAQSKRLWDLSPRVRVLLVFLRAPGQAFGMDLLDWLALSSWERVHPSSYVPWRAIAAAILTTASGVALRAVSKWEALRKERKGINPYGLTVEEELRFRQVMDPKVLDPSCWSHPPHLEGDPVFNLLRFDPEFPIIDRGNYTPSVVAAFYSCSMDSRWGDSPAFTIAGKNYTFELIESLSPTDNVRRAYRFLTEMERALENLSGLPQMRTEEKDFEDVILLYKRWALWTQPLNKAVNHKNKDLLSRWLNKGWIDNPNLIPGNTGLDILGGFCVPLDTENSSRSLALSPRAVTTYNAPVVLLDLVVLAEFPAARVVKECVGRLIWLQYPFNSSGVPFEFRDNYFQYLPGISIWDRLSRMWLALDWYATTVVCLALLEILNKLATSVDHVGLDPWMDLDTGDQPPSSSFSPRWGWIVAGLALGLFVYILATTGWDAWQTASNYTDPALRPLHLPVITGTEWFPTSLTAEEVLSSYADMPLAHSAPLISPATPMHMHGFWER